MIIQCRNQTLKNDLKRDFILNLIIYTFFILFLFTICTQSAIIDSVVAFVEAAAYL